MNLINELKDMGYNYIIMPKRNRSNFWATKAKMVNGDFNDNDDFDESGNYRGNSKNTVIVCNG